MSDFLEGTCRTLSLGARNWEWYGPDCPQYLTDRLSLSDHPDPSVTSNRPIFFLDNSCGNNLSRFSPTLVFHDYSCLEKSIGYLGDCAFQYARRTRSEYDLRIFKKSLANRTTSLCLQLFKHTWQTLGLQTAHSIWGADLETYNLKWQDSLIYVLPVSASPALYCEIPANFRN